MDRENLDILTARKNEIENFEFDSRYSDLIKECKEEIAEIDKAIGLTQDE